MLWSEVRPGDVLVSVESADGKVYHETMMIIDVRAIVPRAFEGHDGILMHPVRVMRQVNNERPDFDTIYVVPDWSTESGGWQSVMRKRA